MNCKIVRFIFLFTILLYHNFSILYSQDSLKQNKNEIKQIMIGEIRISPSAFELSYTKVEAALNLSSELSEKFSLIPEKFKDSVINSIIERNQSTNIISLAQNLNVDKIAFIQVNRLANMIRVDLTLIDTKDTSLKNYGKGYSLIHYFQKQTNKPLSDPFLLEAMQRALADAIGDSLLYDHLPKQLRVYPSPTLVIGGIEFIDDENLPEMQLFKNKVVVSFDLCESIFEEMSKNNQFITYDLSTRDSMFALANFYIVENYNPPTQLELKILTHFDVEYYITGYYKRIINGAKLEIQLCKIENQLLRVINIVNGYHQNDDLEELRNLAKELVKKLLNQIK